jgi:lysozyme
MSLDALAMAIGLVQQGEGCALKAYPDPKWHGIARTSENWSEWGKPWTCGWGETLGVTESTVWTQEEADTRLKARVAGFVLAVLKSCPQLQLEPPARLAAASSLAYNIGKGAFAASSVCARTRRCEYLGAGDAFLLWNKAGGRVMRGLTNRRERERKVYLG